MPATIVPPDKNAKETISKEIVESYIFTTARKELGAYGERLLIRLVELAQREIAGLNFKDGTALCKVKVGEWGEAQISVPIRELLSGDDDKNYAKAKDAIRNLMGKFMEYEDENEYRASHILNDVDVDKVSGIALITVNKNTWNAMLDFSKGFRKYEMNTALRLEGKYSLRIYKLISKQKTPITYSVDEIRRMWQIEDKYKRLSDLVKNTFDTAKDELDQKSPYSFDYTINKPRKKTAKKGEQPQGPSITLYPRYVARNDSLDSMRKMISPTLLLDRETTDLLVNKFGFSRPGIKANISLLDIAFREMDLPGLLDEIAPAALRANNPQGYVIGAIRTRLRERHGIVVDGDTIIRGANAPKRMPNSIKEILKED